MELSEAIIALEGVQRQLRELVKKDTEQELQGVALHVLDATFAAAKLHLRGHANVLAFSDIISPSP